jgi:hypothetical protein
MPRKKVVPGEHTVSQVKQMSIFKVNETLKDIDSGMSKTTALKHNKLDKETFRIITESRHIKLQAIDKKGHYRAIEHTNSYARWEVMWKSGYLTIEELDQKNSSIMGCYWNGVKNAVNVGHSGPFKNVPDFVQNIHGIYIQLEKDVSVLEAWQHKLDGDKSAKEDFDRDLYNLERAIA